MLISKKITFSNMESFYKLSERMDDITMRFRIAQDALDAAMEESGGEITEENEQLVAEVEELAAIKAQIQEQFLEMPDEYGAWYKNVEAQKKMIEAERKAYEEQMKSVLAKFDARIKAKERRMDFIKDNIEAAMKRAEVEGLNKKNRPDSMFSFFFNKSSSIEVNEELALDAFKDAQREVNDKCPEWLEFVPKIKKGVLSKVKDLPFGFERKTSQTLQIR